MPRLPKIPEVSTEDKRLIEVSRLLAELAEERCDRDADFAERSAAAQAVMADAMWLDEELRLRELVSDAPRIAVDGELYRALKSQPSKVAVHGLWGSHVLEEPLYRREGVHNGPTVKPLARRLGLAASGFLPDLASAAGALLACMTSREAKAMLVRLRFRPPSRGVLEDQGIGMLTDMAAGIDAYEEHARAHERLNFDVAAISCGLDRFAVRMDEPLPEGPERDAKLRERAKRQYQRTPPEPYTSVWRMAWTGSVTLYDTDGNARETLRYGIPPDGDVGCFVKRVVEDVLAVSAQHPSAPVVCIQDGAADLTCLRDQLREWLPEGVRREHLVDFYHAIKYLDAVVAAYEAEGDPDSMSSWYRHKLLHEESGVDDILRHLLRKREGFPTGSTERGAIVAAIRYCGRRRKLMRYAFIHADGLPIGSGATESGCNLYQLRVKHAGSHWGSPGLAGTMMARGLSLSNRWDTSFEAYHRTLCSKVRAM